MIWSTSAYSYKSAALIAEWNSIERKSLSLLIIISSESPFKNCVIFLEFMLLHISCQSCHSIIKLWYSQEMEDKYSRMFLRTYFQILYVWRWAGDVLLDCCIGEVCLPLPPALLNSFSILEGLWVLIVNLLVTICPLSFFFLSLTVHTMQLSLWCLHCLVCVLERGLYRQGFIAPGFWVSQGNTLSLERMYVPWKVYF